MSKKSYTELLKDPRWQRKRLEIMEYWGFKCSHCGDRTKPLNVHHGAYEKGRNPWDYPDEMLHCLCDDCHDLAHSHLNAIKWRLGFQPVYQLASLFRILLAQANNDDRSAIQEASLAVASLLGLQDYAEKILEIVTTCWEDRERKNVDREFF